MGVLADRLAYLAGRYGSDAAAWQHEIHAVAALEKEDPKLALERFHALKRRFAEFRRAQLLDELRRFPFVADVPSHDTRGWEMKEIEADIRDATRALTLARGIERAAAETKDAYAALRLRPGSVYAGQAAPAPWNALGMLAAETEALRRVAARELRLDKRLVETQRRARRFEIATPAADTPADQLDAELDRADARLDVLERVEDARKAVAEALRAPEVATYRHDSKRALEREAKEAAAREDLAALQALAARAEALRKEAAVLSSKAARSRRAGTTPPERERRSSDTMDGYG